jgi:hypothetical protein
LSQYIAESCEYIYYSGGGQYPDIVLDFFNNEEFDEQLVFEIIGLISHKTIANFVNNYLASVKERDCHHGSFWLNAPRNGITIKRNCRVIRMSPQLLHLNAYLSGFFGKCLKAGFGCKLKGFTV